MNNESIREILNNITMPADMAVHSCGRSVKISMMRPDTYTGIISLGFSNTVYLDHDITDDGLVKTVFGLLMSYVEHEARESFKYKGQRIFGPHISLEALLKAAPHTTYRNNT